MANVRNVLFVLATVTLALVLVASGFWLGRNWMQGSWGFTMMRPGMMVSNPIDTASDNTLCNDWQGPGRLSTGVAQPGWNNAQGGSYCSVPGIESEQHKIETLEDAEEAFTIYLNNQNYVDLELAEIMQFEQNYYAIVREADTGTGVMELLLDPDSGVVRPEPGPNMMWNNKYGMAGRMMGNITGSDNSISPTEAQDLAQRWLDVNLPGRMAGHPDAFYGYYTLHFLNDGQIEGMISVHATNGNVWYHNWHGSFIAMTEIFEEHG
jgi:hypothetical protein